MTRRRFPTVLVITLVGLALGPLAAADLTFDRYHKPEEIAAALQDLARANPGFAKAHVLARSPGGRDLVLLEVGPETAKTAKTLPAVFVAADMEGTVPLSGEAALWLAKAVCEKADLRSDRTWYTSHAATRTRRQAISASPSGSTAGTHGWHRTAVSAPRYMAGSDSLAVVVLLVLSRLFFRVAIRKVTVQGG